jgi:capsular polysaccharide biosynthesis protein
MIQIGTYTELLSTSASFSRLLEDINQYQQEQTQQATTMANRLSKINSISMENEDEAEIASLLTEIEPKQEGTVKWNVYVSYLRAGIGVVVGTSLILTVYSAHQALHLYSNRWLAEWSDEENHRFRVSNNCTNVFTQKIQRIRSMNDIEWNEYRAERFYGFSSKLFYYI